MVIERFVELGYRTMLFLLNAATMGMPQKRVRVFFIATRAVLHLPKLTLNFNERPILYREIRGGTGRSLDPSSKTYNKWLKRRPRDMCVGYIMRRTEAKENNFNTILVHDKRVLNTIASNSQFVRYNEPNYISEQDIIRAQTFPQDYDFLDADVQYICGMSVPPVMMKNIAEQIAQQ